MYPHRIRLRKPWESEPLPDRVRYRRRFGYPGRIDEYERVWLTVAGTSGRADVTLNGIALGRGEQPGQPFEFEITSLLKPRNELVIEIAGSVPEATLLGEVAMEVRRTAHLRNVRFLPVWQANSLQLQATGEVAGVADGLLELYLLLDRSTIAYQTVAAGTPFEIVSEAIPLIQWRSLAVAPLALDLIQGATVWYRVEQVFPTDNG